MSKQKVVAIIQARMASTRFPGKVMKEIYGKPVLQWMVERIKIADEIDMVIIATTENSNQIHRLCLDKKWFFLIGSVEDVLGRVYKTAKFTYADIIVDLTGDCPLVDPRHIDYLIYQVKYEGYDYACNIHPRSWADGFDVQVYTMDVLEKLHLNIQEDIKARQHVGWNIHHREAFIPLNIFNLAPTNSAYNIPNIRITLDYPEDLEVISSIIKHFVIEQKIEYPSAEQISQYILNNPDILVNKHLQSKIPGEG